MIAGGHRPAWETLPAEVRSAVAEVLRAPVTAVSPVRGGFSPGVAALVRSRHDAVFVKAASRSPNAFTVELYREEAARDALLPPGLRRPALRAHLDVGGWTALVFDAVPGRLPRRPWDRVDLAAVVELLCEHPAAAPGTPTAAEQFADELGGWARLAADRPAVSGAWWPSRLAELVDLERRWPSVAAGDRILHADMRADNVVLTAGGPVLVDWAYACRGNPLFDVVHLLLDARAAGDLDGPIHLAEQARTALGASDGDLAVLVAVFAGWYTDLARRPPLPGLPTLRGFQHELAVAGTAWLREYLDA